VIIPDINLLVYAYNEDAPLHAAARAWWEQLMNSHVPLALPWVVSCGFVRLLTHPAVLVSPLRPADAIAIIALWYSRSHVQAVNPGPRHLVLFRDLLAAAGVAGNLTTDAHIAAIAIEHQCELHSNDSDFGRFAGLRWRNPLA
jgi:toxin-antitoxin system PIN domain toxin